MQAVRIHQFGGPGVLKVEAVPDPQAGPGEVVVEVRAGSVNPVDYKIRNGGYLPPEKLPITLGRDVAGVVSAVGPGVEGRQVGDRVYAMLPPDRGGYAERVAAPAHVFAKAPQRLDFVQGAAVPLAALTAWQGLFDNGKLEKGQTVLVHGAAGGVGHFAVQFAKAVGAGKVFATCSAADEAFVHDLGADLVIDYKAERFEELVEKVDLVLDLIGRDTLQRSFQVLRRGGVLVSTLEQPDPARCAEFGITGRHFMAQPSGDQLAQIANLIDAGRVTPHVDRTYSLDRAAEAEDLLEHGHVQGKLVLTVH